MPNPDDGFVTLDPNDVQEVVSLPPPTTPGGMRPMAAHTQQAAPGSDEEVQKYLDPLGAGRLDVLIGGAKRLGQYGYNLGKMAIEAQPLSMLPREVPESVRDWQPVRGSADEIYGALYGKERGHQLVNTAWGLDDTPPERIAMGPEGQVVDAPVASHAPPPKPTPPKYGPFEEDLKLRNKWQEGGATATDLATALAVNPTMELPAGVEALIGAASKGGRVARTLARVPEAINQAAVGGVYGAATEQDPLAGAMFGAGTHMLVGGHMVPTAISNAADRMVAHAKTNLGRALNPTTKANKAFVEKHAEDIIKQVDWVGTGGLSGFAEKLTARADDVGQKITTAMQNARQQDVAPLLASSRRELKRIVGDLRVQVKKQQIELAPKTAEALERASDILNGLNPTDTNLSGLRLAHETVNNAVYDVRLEVQNRVRQTRIGWVGQVIDSAIKSGQPQRARQAMRGARAGIEGITDLVEGTRAPTQPIVDAIENAKNAFRTKNAAGRWVHNVPEAIDNLTTLQDQIRAYGPEMSADALWKVKQQWGEVVAGASGRGWYGSIADETRKGALREATGVMRTTLTDLRPETKALNEQYHLLSGTADVIGDTLERRTGQTGGLMKSLTTAGGGLSGTGSLLGYMTGVLGPVGAAVGVAASALVPIATTVLKSPEYNLLAAKTRLALAAAVRRGDGNLLRSALQRVTLELMLKQEHGIDGPVSGGEDLTDDEAAYEQARLKATGQLTPEITDRGNPDSAYGDTLGDPNYDDDDPSPNPPPEADPLGDLGTDTTGAEVGDPDYTGGSDTPAPPADEQARAGAPPEQYQAGMVPEGLLKRGLQWAQTPLLEGMDIEGHPTLSRATKLAARFTDPLNLTFAAGEVARPLAAGTRFAGAAEGLGKAASATMGVAGLQNVEEGIRAHDPAQVVGGGTQAIFGGMGLRGGGVARAAGEGAEAAGSYLSKAGRGLAEAGKQAVVMPALLGGGAHALAQTDLAKSVIEDEGTREAIANALLAGGTMATLHAAAKRGGKIVPGVKGPVTVKRSPTFAEDGNYHVALPDGRTYEIYRDTPSTSGAQRQWYVQGLEEHPGLSAETQGDLIRSLARLDESEPARNRFTGRSEGKTVAQVLAPRRREMGVATPDAPLKLSAESGFKGNEGIPDELPLSQRKKVVADLRRQGIGARSPALDKVPAKGRDFPAAFDFESQKPQFDETGEPGISYEKGDLGGKNSDGEPMHVDSLKYRDENGKLIGVLYHYPMDITQPGRGGGAYGGMTQLIESAGNVNVLVDPAVRRQGVATKLLGEAIKRWNVDLSAQDYTKEGRAFARDFTTPGRERTFSMPSPAEVRASGGVEAIPGGVRYKGRDIPFTLPKMPAKGDRLVTVDVAKLDAGMGSGWRVTPGGKPGPGSGAISDRYARFGKFLDTNPESIEAPNVHVNADGGVIFGDGRHRTAFLRDAGLKEMPVTMDAESARNAQKHGLLPTTGSATEVPGGVAVKTPGGVRVFHGSAEIRRRGGLTGGKFTRDIDPAGRARDPGANPDTLGTWWTTSRKDAEHYGQSYGFDERGHAIDTPVPGAVVEGNIDLKNPRVFNSGKEWFQFVEGLRDKERRPATREAVIDAIGREHDGIIVKGGGVSDAAPEGGDFHVAFDDSSFTFDPSTAHDRAPGVGEAGEGSALQESKASGGVQSLTLGKGDAHFGVIKKALKENGGFSVDMQTNTAPQTGTFVGLYPNNDPRVKVVPKSKFNETVLGDYVKSMQKELGQKDRVLGVWEDGGKIYMDVPLRVRRDEKVKLDKKTGAPKPEQAAVKARRIEAQERAAIVRGGGKTRTSPSKSVREAGQQLSTYTADTFTTRDVGDWRGYIESPTFERRVMEQADAGLRSLQSKGVQNPEWWKLRGTTWEKLYADQPDGTMSEGRMKQVAGALAATAPNAGTTENVRQATEYLRRMLKNEPTVQPDWRAKPGENVTHLSEGSMMPMEKNRKKNLVLARLGEGIKMRADKVREEFKALMGDPDAQVLDTHFAKIGEEPSSGVYINTAAGKIAGKEYPIMAARLRGIAKKLGRVPRDFTAEVWTGIRENVKKHGELYGRKHKRAEGESYGYDQILDREIKFTADKLGVTTADVERRIRAGDMNLLAAVLASSAALRAAASAGFGGAGQPASDDQS